MAKKPPPFSLVYAPMVKEHLKATEPKYYSLIRGTIERQLQFEPDGETRNRKPLRRPAVLEAEWEIRFGPQNCFRVYYEVNGHTRRVHILAIGRKKGSRLYIGGEEIEL